MARWLRLRGFVTDHVEPRATVITDGWAGYSGLEKLGYVHDRRSQRAARACGEDPGALLPGYRGLEKLGYVHDRRSQTAARTGGDDPNEMDEAIIQYMRKKHNLLIGEPTAEQIKIRIGSAYRLDDPETMPVKGRHLLEGVPKTITISDEEVREALAEPVNVIVDAVRVALERTPPELSADIVDRGIVLTGGGAMLKHMAKRLGEETGLPVAMAEDPASCVVLGAGKMLSDFGLLGKISK